MTSQVQEIETTPQQPKKADYSKFNSSILKLVKSLGPDTRIKKTSTSIIDLTIKRLVNKIIKRSVDFNNTKKSNKKSLSSTGSKTIDHHVVKTAITYLFAPDRNESAKRALDNAEKILSNYLSSKRVKTDGRTSRNNLAETSLSISKLETLSRSESGNMRFTRQVSPFLSGFIESIVMEWLRDANVITEDLNMVTIKPRSLGLSIIRNPGLKEIFNDITIAGGGVDFMGKVSSPKQPTSSRKKMVRRKSKPTSSRKPKTSK